MRDDIQHTLAELGRAAERAAAPVGFDGIRRRARRRRRAQTLSAVALCVVAAGAGLGIDQATGSHRSVGPAHHGSPHPSPTTAPTHDTPSPTPRLSPRQIVEDPRSFVVGSSVDSHDSHQAAMLWQLGSDWTKAQYALSTTIDGYRHVRYLSPPVKYQSDCRQVLAVGHHAFWLACGEGNLLVVGDRIVSVPQPRADRGPVPKDAALVPPLSLRGGAYWFDTRGILRAVPLRAAVDPIHAPDGRIWGRTFAGGSNRLLSSTDGGRSWSSRPLPPLPPADDEYAAVPTAVPGQMVLARGSAASGPYGGAFFPHSILIFGSDGQQVQQTQLRTGRAQMGSAVVTPDGSLVMELLDPNGASGVFRASAGRWADLHKVLDLPTNAQGQTAESRWVGNSVDFSGRPVVWAVFDSGVLATSTDDGQTWTTRSIR